MLIREWGIRLCVRMAIKYGNFTYMQGPHILQDLYSSETYVFWMEVVNILKDNNMAQWGCSQFCINDCEEVSVSNIRYIKRYFGKIMYN
jgi:hypothetical protein